MITFPKLMLGGVAVNLPCGTADAVSEIVGEPLVAVLEIATVLVAVPLLLGVN